MADLSEERLAELEAGLCDCGHCCNGDLPRDLVAEVRRLRAWQEKAAFSWSEERGELEHERDEALARVLDLEAAFTPKQLQEFRARGYERRNRD